MAKDPSGFLTGSGSASSAPPAHRFAAVEAALRIGQASAAERALGLPDGGIQPPAKPACLFTESTGAGSGWSQGAGDRGRHDAHPGSLIVEVVGEPLIFAGDVLDDGRLSMAVMPDSRTDGWIRRPAGLRRCPVRAGQGAAGPLGDFEPATHRYLTTLKTHMGAAIKDGAELQEAIDSLDQTPWQGLADLDTLARHNAH